ncbi:MAG: hypothetical protein ACXVJD_15130, partial [Mucilaginibacter sp.]
MKTENKELTNDIHYTPMSEMANYHRQIEEKYLNNPSAGAGTNPDTQALMAFNGYYTLNTAAGAFFAIDTNMFIQSGSAQPVYVLDLLISLDGVTSARFPFTGTFDGTHLKETSEAMASVDIDLTFTHTDGSDGTTASCSGTIALPGKTAVTVSGSTYNNPIPSSLFTGTYYQTIADAPVKTMSIDNYQILYDNGLNNGELHPVTTYVYNLNMYYFSFTQGDNS